MYKIVKLIDKSWDTFNLYCFNTKWEVLFYLVCHTVASCSWPNKDKKMVTLKISIDPSYIESTVTNF